MDLGELFSRIAEVQAEYCARTVSGVTSDSREVRENFVFVCIKGASFDGHTAAKVALQKGAAAVVTEN